MNSAHPIHRLDGLLRALGWEQFEREELAAQRWEQDERTRQLTLHMPTYRVTIDSRTYATIRCEPDGSIESIRTERDGRRHGFSLDVLDGIIQFMTLEDGVEHGVGLNFDRETFLSAYAMHHGSGVEHWYEPGPTLSGSCVMRDGMPHGAIRYWFDEECVYEEEHAFFGARHGIRRLWDESLELADGFPEFYVEGRRVSHEVYENACQHDPLLMAYEPEGDDPERDAPPRLSLTDVPTLDDILTSHIPESLAHEDVP